MPITLEQSQVNEIATMLYNAERDKKAINPITAIHPRITIEDAYAIQSYNVSRKVTNGDKHLGWKIGLTSQAMQKVLGVNEPDFGHLLQSMRLQANTNLKESALISPRIEPEIAFILQSDLRGPGVSKNDVLNATRYITPALEIIDSRIRNWQVEISDTIADNASGAYYLLGKNQYPLEDLDLASIWLDFGVDGRIVSSAGASAVLGHPANAVAWLCNAIAPLGKNLLAGQVVMSGSLIGAIEMNRGHTFYANFTSLGTIDLKII